MAMVWIFLVATLTLAGCAGTTDKGKSYYAYKNTAENEILTDMPCGNAVDPCTKGMRDARVTNNPADEEFWQFEARVMVRALVGIPYGRMPQDFNVIGSKERCESARATVTDPTDPCKGPFYFKRD
jgi:hypothetical protein